ncbi:MAG: helix-turn-helix domain-containing protein [Ignavibacteriales bacterium]|nr:MAG: helix-turn-helix domain-containing protein [Ignavibacteriales bacterium]
MLKFNFKSVFAARGIQSPTGFLRRAGFSPHTASYIATGKVEKLNLKLLERLCILLNCTPHDLLEWVPDTKLADPGRFELSKLAGERKVHSLQDDLSELTLGKVEEVKRFIEEKRKETTSPPPPLLGKERGE